MTKIVFLLWISGSWKTTILHASGLLHHPHFVYVPSFTTRPLRNHETNWEKYIHISDEEFQKKIANHDFLEYARVHQSAFYGTDYASITAPLHQGKNSIKELEIYWLMKIQEEKRIEELYTTIFLDIPLTLMKQRITQRQHVDDDELTKRMESAVYESEALKMHCEHRVDATQPLEVVCDRVKEICFSL